MSNKIVLDKKHNEHIDDVGRWLLTSVGQGSFRGNPNTWMGTDNWFYYEEELNEEEYLDADDFDPCYVFVFRHEADAMMFSLKWS